ncbi:GL15587 [Drosophila persimilis]|uniref:GL15587 n=1 Tax=Drosophila persimilis TaxID=7234 RepID=B4H6N3_DROPE|nr:GL15587 [Drosophila persimilis]
MKSNGDVEAATPQPVAGSKTSNGHGHGQSNGNGNGNGTGNGNGYHQNGGRRDSTQAFTPLLAQHNQTNGEGLGNQAPPATPTGNTVLYESTPSNNNEWKASEDINNLKERSSGAC